MTHVCEWIQDSSLPFCEQTHEILNYRSKKIDCVWDWTSPGWNSQSLHQSVALNTATVTCIHRVYITVAYYMNKLLRFFSTKIWIDTIQVSWKKACAEKERERETLKSFMTKSLQTRHPRPSRRIAIFQLPVEANPAAIDSLTMHPPGDNNPFCWWRNFPTTLRTAPVSPNIFSNFWLVPPHEKLYTRVLANLHHK